MGLDTSLAKTAANLKECSGRPRKDMALAFSCSSAHSDADGHTGSNVPTTQPKGKPQDVQVPTSASNICITVSSITKYCGGKTLQISSWTQASDEMPDYIIVTLSKI